MASIRVSFNFQETKSIKSYFTELGTFLNNILQFLVNLKQGGIHNSHTEAIKAAFKIIVNLYHEKKFENEDQLNKALTEANKQWKVIIENSKILQSSLSGDKKNLKTIISGLLDLKEINKMIQPGGEESLGTIRTTFVASPETKTTITSTETHMRNLLMKINLLLLQASSAKDKAKLETIKTRIHHVMKSLHGTEFHSEAKLKTELNKSVSEIHSATTEVDNVIKSGHFDNKQKEELQTKSDLLGTIRIIFDASPETKRTVTSIESNMTIFFIKLNLLLQSASAKDKTKLETIKTRFKEVTKGFKKSVFKSEEELKIELNKTVAEINSVGSEVNDVIKMNDFNYTQKKDLEVLLEALRNLGTNYKHLNIHGVDVPTGEESGEIVLTFNASNNTKSNVMLIYNKRWYIARNLELLEKDKQLKNNEQFKHILNTYKAIFGHKRYFTSQEALIAWLKIIASKINTFYTDVDNLVTSGSFKGETLANIERLRRVLVFFTQPFQHFGINLAFSNIRTPSSSKGIEVTFNVTSDEKDIISKLNYRAHAIESVLLDRILEDSHLRNNKDIIHIAIDIRTVLSQLRFKFETRNDLNKALTSTVWTINQVITHLDTLLRSREINTFGQLHLQQLLIHFIRIGRYYEALGIQGIVYKGRESNGRIEIHFESTEEVKRNVYYINNDIKQINSVWQQILHNMKLRYVANIVDIAKSIYGFQNKLSHEYKSRNELDYGLKMSVTQINNAINGINELIKSQDLDVDDEKYFKTILELLFGLGKWFKALGVTGIQSSGKPNGRIQLDFNASHEVKSSVEEINALLQQGQHLLKVLPNENINKKVDELINELTANEYKSETDLKKRLISSVNNINAIISTTDKMLTSGKIKGIEKIHISLLLNVLTALYEPYLNINIKGINITTDYCPCSKRN